MLIKTQGYCEGLNSKFGSEQSLETGGEKRDKTGRRKSVFRKINEDWNTFLKEIGSASTMNAVENQL